MGACTAPKLFGMKAWFDARFAELCEEHDRRYVLREGSKLQADWALAKGMAKKGHPVVAAVTLAFCLSPIGIWYWVKE